MGRPRPHRLRSHTGHSEGRRSEGARRRQPWLASAGNNATMSVSAPPPRPSRPISRFPIFQHAFLEGPPAHGACHARPPCAPRRASRGAAARAAPRCAQMRTLTRAAPRSWPFLGICALPDIPAPPPPLPLLSPERTRRVPRATIVTVSYIAQRRRRALRHGDTPSRPRTPGMTSAHPLRPRIARGRGHWARPAHSATSDADPAIGAPGLVSDLALRCAAPR